MARSNAFLMAAPYVSTFRSWTSDTRSTVDVFVTNVRSIVTWSTTPACCTYVNGSFEQPVLVAVLHRIGETSGAKCAPPSRDCSNVYGAVVPVTRQMMVA